MQAAGIDGDRVYFLLEDHHFLDPTFYATIDSLLASGEVRISYIIWNTPLLRSNNFDYCFFRYLESTQMKSLKRY